MQNISIFDMVIIGITLVLGLKGLFRGFIKEVFGIVGIIGAIFVASRFASQVGGFIAPYLTIENETSIKLIGFVITLIVFWVVVYLLGTIISKMFSASGLGIVDRILGFIFGAAKVFLIFSVIAYALYQIQSFKNVIDKRAGDSFVLPHLVSIGSYIIKLDTSKITDNIDKAIDTVTPETQDETPASTDNEENSVTNSIKDSVNQTVQDTKDAVQQEVTQKVEDTVKDMTNATQEKVDLAKEKLQETIQQ